MSDDDRVAFAIRSLAVAVTKVADAIMVHAAVQARPDIATRSAPSEYAATWVRNVKSDLDRR